MKNKIKITGALAVFSLLLLSIAGMTGAQSTVTATYNGSYVPGTCVLGIANSTSINGDTGLGTSVIDLSSGTGTLYLANLGTADSLGNPTSLSVNAYFQDNDLGAAAYGGWYISSSFVSGITTSWESSQYGANFYPLIAASLFSTSGQGPVYSDIPSTGSYGWDYPITFSVTASPTLPKGTYNQQILLSGSC